jgi:hypothetical protein
MALKYHVGLRLAGKVESMGATDTLLAANMLLDCVRIGLGLYTMAGGGLPSGMPLPSPAVHPEEQATPALTYAPSHYSTALVQRLVAQLVNRGLVGVAELTHAYVRAQAAGCQPGACYTSVESALASGRAAVASKAAATAPMGPTAMIQHVGQSKHMPANSMYYVSAQPACATVAGVGESSLQGTIYHV